MERVPVPFDGLIYIRATFKQQIEHFDLVVKDRMKQNFFVAHELGSFINKLL